MSKMSNFVTVTPFLPIPGIRIQLAGYRYDPRVVRWRGRGETPLVKSVGEGDDLILRDLAVVIPVQGCQTAKFVPFLSLDCARVEGEGAESKERKGSNFAA